MKSIRFWSATATWSLVLGLVFGMSAAHAQPTTASSAGIGGQSTASIPSSSTLDAIKKKAMVSYYGIYYGPAMENMTGSRRTDEYGKDVGNQFLLNYLGLGYKASPTLNYGLTVMSKYTPVRGQDLTLLDPYLRLTDAKAAQIGGATLYSEARVFLPVTRESHNVHKGLTLGTFQMVNYAIPNSRFSLGAWAKLYWTMYGPEAKPGTVPFSNTDGQAFFRPEIFYKITRDVSAAAYYEMYGNHLLGKAANDWYNAGTNVQLGAMVNVISGLTLNPYFLINTGGKVATDSTAIGAQIFASVL